jgi:hypothetical protein
MAGLMGAVAAGLAVWKYTEASSKEAQAKADPPKAAPLEAEAQSDKMMAILFAAGAVLGIITAMSMGKAKGQADDSANDFSPTAYNGGGLAPSDYKAGDIPPEVAAAIGKAKADLAKAGVKADFGKGTFTTKDGKSYDAAKVANGSAGLPGGAGAFNAAMDKVKKEADAKMAARGGGSVESDMGGGGGGGSRVVNISDEGVGGGDGSVASKKSREEISAIGESKSFKGEKIGVAADHIFSMLCRRTVTEVERGKTMEGAVGRKPSDCDNSPMMAVPPAFVEQNPARKTASSPASPK